MSVLTPPNDLATLTDEQLLAMTNDTLKLMQQDRQDWQLLYYRPNSPQHLKLHCSRAHTIGAGGGNRCIPLDAPVLMADGSWKPLGDIRVGDMVIGVDELGKRGRPSTVRNIFRSTGQVLKFSCSDGTSFRVTPDHHVPLYLGSGRKTTKGNLKLPHKRRIGDYIQRTGTLNVSKRIAAIQPKDIEFHYEGPYPNSLNLYLLGLLIGDGTFSATLRLSCGNATVLERFRVLAAKHGCALVHYGQYDYGVTSQKGKGRRINLIKQAIVDLGLWGCTSYTKFIPLFIFNTPRSMRMEFLAGLIDSDGSKHAFTTCSVQLANDFEKLVHTLGGKSTSRVKMTKSQTGKLCQSYRIYFRLNEPLELCCTWKQSTGARAVDYQRKVLRSVDSLGVQKCGDIEVDHPGHCYVTEGYTIVSNSGKTDSALAEAVIQSTGVIPESLRDVWPREKFRGPINVRVVCESHTTTLAPVILYKLQYNNWSGVDAQGGERGHWGWIPKSCLIDGDWDRSWKDAKRQLKVLCRDPDNLDRILGVSTWQFMSADQEPAKFASGEFHLIIMDEPPKYAIYRENCARVMSVGGRMILAMTWPDDPSIPVDWIFDEIYEVGQPGPHKDPDVDWIVFDTTKNPHIDQESVAKKAAGMSEIERNTRIKGQPIRFANRVHPLFTDGDSWWCFTCHEEILRQPDGSCRKCLSDNNAMFNHVQDFVIDPRWPTIYVLDPHPRKPHMMEWFQVDGNDDYSSVFSLHIADTPDEMAKACKQVEDRFRLDVRLRLMDPNMGASPSGTRRDVTWQQEFADAGIACDLASDSDVGRGRVNEYLRPDDRTRRPRIRWHQEHCQSAVHQMKRFVWDDFRYQDNKDQKQKPKPKYDDHPGIVRYLLNALPLCRILKSGAPLLKPRGQRKGGY